MIGKQTKGRSFRGLLNYLHSREGANIIGGNMSGRKPRELAREFRLSHQLNPSVQRVVYHVSLSLPPHERLDDDAWNEVSQKYLEGMGFTANQYVVYHHHDTDHDHVHIAASRIRLDDGSCVHDGWDYLRSEAVIRRLEREYGLEAVQSSRKQLKRAVSQGQFKRMEREGAEYEQGVRDDKPEQSVKQRLQGMIDDAATDAPTMPDLIERLQRRGVTVQHGFTRTGKSKGISYGLDGEGFSGTQLGAAYTFPGLQKHQRVDYESERDDERIRLLMLHPHRRLVEQGLVLPDEEDSNKVLFTPATEGTVAETAEYTASDMRTLRDDKPFKKAVSTAHLGDGRSAHRRRHRTFEEAGNSGVDEASSITPTHEQMAIPLKVDGFVDEVEFITPTHERTATPPRGDCKVDEVEETPRTAVSTQAVSPQVNPDYAQIYQRLSSGLEHLSVDDRDKHVIKHLMLLERPPEEFRDMILATLPHRTREEAKQLVIQAETELRQQRQSEQEREQERERTLSQHQEMER